MAGRIDQIVYRRTLGSDLLGRGGVGPVASSLDAAVLAEVDQVIGPLVRHWRDYPHVGLRYLVTPRWTALLFRGAENDDYRRPSSWAHVLVGGEDDLPADIALGAWRCRWVLAIGPEIVLPERLDPIDAEDLAREAHPEWQQLAERGRRIPAVDRLIVELLARGDPRRGLTVITSDSGPADGVLLLAGLLSRMGPELLAGGFSAYDNEFGGPVERYFPRFVLTDDGSRASMLQSDRVVDLRAALRLPDRVVAEAANILAESYRHGSPITDLAQFLADRPTGTVEDLVRDVYLSQLPPLGRIASEPEELPTEKALISISQEWHESLPQTSILRRSRLRDSLDWRRREVYPLLEAPDQVVVGEEFDLTVGIGPTAMDGVAGLKFKIPRRRLVLGAQILADGFQLAPGQPERVELALTSAEPFPRVTVRVTAGPQEQMVRAAQIRVVYDIGGKVVGLGARAIAVLKSADAPAPDVRQDLEKAAFTVRSKEPAPDLTVTVSAGDGPGRWLWTYRSPHFSRSGPPEVCDLGVDGAREFAYRLISQVQRHWGQADLKLFLQGTGGQIADKIPAGFWRALAQVSAKTSPHPPTVLLLSEEPHVPWELAWLSQPIFPELPAYLGCQVTIGRWTLRNRMPPLPSPARKAATMAVVTGVYSERRLQQAEEEARLLAETYRARHVRADKRSVLALLNDNPIADLVHFVAHGRADPDGKQSGIILVDGETLEPEVIRARHLNGTPFIFLNVCELGTGQQVLGGDAGMAHAFQHSGACGVTAPLWAVSDEAAKNHALTFYDRVFAGALPAEVLRDLRCGPGGPDLPANATALAYQFFGHPAMTIRRRRRGRAHPGGTAQQKIDVS